MWLILTICPANEATETLRRLVPYPEPNSQNCEAVSNVERSQVVWQAAERRKKKKIWIENIVSVACHWWYIFYAVLSVQVDAVRNQICTLERHFSPAAVAAAASKGWKVRRRFKQIVATVCSYIRTSIVNVRKFFCVLYQHPSRIAKRRGNYCE